jgi:hypothetical protein
MVYAGFAVLGAIVLAATRGRLGLPVETPTVVIGKEVAVAA